MCWVSVPARMPYNQQKEAGPAEAEPCLIPIEPAGYGVELSTASLGSAAESYGEFNGACTTSGVIFC